ncbi:MAG: HAD family hydrolase [Candidatus Korobacteraceae bacterium]
MKRPAIFLDRDGVINYDFGYANRTDEIRFIDGIFNLLKIVRKAGYVAIVITNQAGIARGYYSEEDVKRTHEWMRARFRENGADVDAFYYCPFHPDATVPNYRADSPDRKPAPGMILQAAADWSIDLPRSLLVGDKESDLEAGRRAQVGMLILFDPAADAAMCPHDDGFKVGSLFELARNFENIRRGSLAERCKA